MVKNEFVTILANSHWLRLLKQFGLCTLVIPSGFVVAETTHTVPLFLAASNDARDGFLRLINHSADEADVEILAFDEAGREMGPISLSMEGRHTVHFDSDDLENGDTDDLLSEGVGSGDGDWRLELTSESDIEVLVYVRTSDGFLTTMHDTVPGAENEYQVAIFNPASNVDQISRLRLINAGELDASVSITGIDVDGESPGEIVTLDVAAGTSRDVTAAELESDGLGDGDGRWRLSVESDQPLIVLNLLETSTGHLINLSSNASSRRVPMFPNASNHGFQGLVGMLNRSDESGEVSITAVDSTGEAYEPVELVIQAGETAYLSSDDLEQGNADIGLSTGIGAGTGDWHLTFESELDIQINTYLEFDNGFFTSIHDVASGTEFRSRVPTFNAQTDSDLVSKLRVVNTGDSIATVRIQGIDDSGDWSSVVAVSIPDGSVADLDAGQLETGDEALAGMLGEGTGDWQLIVRSDQPVLVLSLLQNRDGQVTSLSSAPYDRAEIAFEHEQTFTTLVGDRYRSIEHSFDSYGWYTNNYELAKYVGYQDLLTRYEHRLPTGRGITVLQAESTHTPEDIGDVMHLFEYGEESRHSRTVAEILTENKSYPLLYTRYSTFSAELDSFHTTTTANLRAFLVDEDQSNSYPLVSYDDIPVAPAKLLNVSNTNGGGAATTRRFDKFVEENDLVACTAHSSLPSGNVTTSGMAYNSIVVGQKYQNTFAFDGAKHNDHGSPRYKPDITARSSLAATSYSSPQVCSAAALLLERAKLDPLLSNAYRSVTIKSILMAAATRFNYRIAVEWDNVSPVDPLFMNGPWERTSDELPTSPKYGAGALNVFTAYEILSAGEFDGGFDEDIGMLGWDYARDLTEGDAVEYQLTVEEDVMFSAVLVWHRHIDDDWLSYLPDYELEVFDEGGSRVAYSNNNTSNVELVEVELEQGSYTMEVRVVSDGDNPDSLNYGLAWVNKATCDRPEGFQIDGNDAYWSLTWDAPEDPYCRKYRLEIRSGSEESDEIEAEVFLDVNAYSYSKPDDTLDRYFRLSNYPNDGSVSYRYPSSVTRAVGEH
ncbi:MAG: hypothetical protein OXG25_01740 [Gammaproteobacteria bacterium]|nr:hypothetical protein [Gammaproteobacteria bacterium]